MNRIAHVSIIDTAVGQIKDLILSGTLRAGEKLPTEMELCNSCGVGRSSIREACRTLKALGYIEMKPGKGMFVAFPAESPGKTTEWFAAHKLETDDYFDVRFAIEPYAVRLAAERAEPEELAELQNLHRAYLALVGSGDAERLAIYDRSFHEQIVRLTHNELMLGIIHKVSDDIVKYITMVNKISSKPQITADSHTAILNALLLRDADAGAKAMQEHLSIAQSDVKSIQSI